MRTNYIIANKQNETKETLLVSNSIFLTTKNNRKKFLKKLQKNKHSCNFFAIFCNIFFYFY
jgi:hypothetical protein